MHFSTKHHMGGASISTFRKTADQAIDGGLLTGAGMIRAGNRAGSWRMEPARRAGDLVRMQGRAREQRAPVWGH